MTERLDRIDAQQAINTANIADLITMSGNLLRVVEANAAAIAELRTNTEILRDNTAESDNRFNILIAEMRADRAAMEAEMRAKSSETETLFNILIAEMRADRQALNGRIDNLEQAG
jgi:hypothetical protein